MIPRLFLVFGVDIELAGLSLAMGLPTMPFGFAATAATVVSLSLSKKSPVRVDDVCRLDPRHLYRRLPTLWSLANWDRFGLGEG
jgi:hypothetical protein